MVIVPLLLLGDHPVHLPAEPVAAAPFGPGQRAAGRPVDRGGGQAGPARPGRHRRHERGGRPRCRTRHRPLHGVGPHRPLGRLGRRPAARPGLRAVPRGHWPWSSGRCWSGWSCSIRAAAVYVAVLFLPLALASLAWPAIAHWCRRLVDTLVALVLGKFVIVSVLSLAAGALAGGTGRRPPTGCRGAVPGRGLHRGAGWRRPAPAGRPSPRGRSSGSSPSWRRAPSVTSKGWAGGPHRRPRSRRGLAQTGPAGDGGRACHRCGGASMVGGCPRRIGGRDRITARAPRGAARSLGTGGPGGAVGGVPGGRRVPPGAGPDLGPPRRGSPASARCATGLRDTHVPHPPRGHRGWPTGHGSTETSDRVGAPPAFSSTPRHPGRAQAPAPADRGPRRRLSGPGPSGAQADQRAPGPNHRRNPRVRPVADDGRPADDEPGPLPFSRSRAARGDRRMAGRTDRRGGRRPGLRRASPCGQSRRWPDPRRRPAGRGVGRGLAFWPVAGRTGEQWLPLVVRWSWAGVGRRPVQPAPGPVNGHRAPSALDRAAGRTGAAHGGRCPTADRPGAKHRCFDGLRLTDGSRSVDALGRPDGRGDATTGPAPPPRCWPAGPQLRPPRPGGAGRPDRGLGPGAVVAGPRGVRRVHRVQWVESCLPDDGGCGAGPLVRDHAVLGADTPAGRSYRALRRRGGPGHPAPPGAAGPVRPHRGRRGPSVGRPWGGRCRRGLTGGARPRTERWTAPTSGGRCPRTESVWPGHRRDHARRRPSRSVDGVEGPEADCSRPPDGVDRRPRTRRPRPSGGPWPMVVEPHWDAVRTDGTWHATYWIAEWPRVDVTPRLPRPAAVLAPCGGPCRW